MQEVEGQGNFGRVEPGVLFGKASLTLHVEHEVAAADELDDKEQPGRRLEAGVEPHQERMVRGRFEDVLLRLNPVNVLQNSKKKINPLKNHQLINVTETKKTAIDRGSAAAAELSSKPLNSVRRRKLFFPRTFCIDYSHEIKCGGEEGPLF